MRRIIAYCLVLLVLFTHSTMAMDVHLPHTSDHHSSTITADSLSAELHGSEIDNMVVDDINSICTDAGGHCSHHQAHSAGLLSVNSLIENNLRPVLIGVVKNVGFLISQAPPIRPPKS